MLILASASPRRKELIGRLGIDFEICPSNADESLPPSLPPEEAVKLLSKRKAEQVAQKFPEDIVLGVDTVVFADGEILGKPENTADAKRMLRILSGKTHQVFSGFTLIQKGKTYSECVGTDVTFAPLTEQEIDRYIVSEEPMDKAGAYGIQGLGGLFVTGICGDYHSVVGLPLQAIYRALQTHFGVEFT